MGEATAPPVSLPYPVGTDLLRDGDDAIKALAERLHSAMPRGILASAGVIGDKVIGTQIVCSTVPIPIPEGNRYLQILFVGSCVAAAGTGFAFMPQWNGGQFGRRDWLAANSYTTSMCLSWFHVPAAGDSVYAMNVAAHAAEGNTLMGGSAMYVIDHGIHPPGAFHDGLMTWEGP